MHALSLILIVALFGTAANAQTSPEPSAASVAPPTLDTVLVTGEQPGPGLWKVTRRDSDHVLWILGTLSPLPKTMTWHADDVEKTIAQSQEVLADAQAKADINPFRMLFLFPTYLSAKKNADGKKLVEVLPPELYQRWLALKTRYIGRDNGVEKLRPMLAAGELYRKAIGKSGLSNKNVVWNVIEAAAKKDKVRVTEVAVKIPIDDPKQALNDFKTTAGDLDVSCLATTITRLETDLGAMRARANAWAVGDLHALKNLPYPDQRAACLAAVASNPRLAEKLDDAQKRIDGEWITAAEKALSQNASTLAVLPIVELVKPNGRLATLRAKNYEIEEPQ